MNHCTGMSKLAFHSWVDDWLTSHDMALPVRVIEALRQDLVSERKTASYVWQRWSVFGHIRCCDFERLCQEERAGSRAVYRDWWKEHVPSLKFETTYATGRYWPGTSQVQRQTWCETHHWDLNHINSTAALQRVCLPFCM